jgi:glyceraldehyde-3-phosphate dehydrogenase/erythrose-4-phosphate dehydrogenase
MKELSNIKLDTKSTIDLTYKVIVYAAILPLAVNSASFKTWATKNNNKNLLVQSLETIYYIASTSDDAAKAVTDVLKLFKSKCGCSCFSVPLDKTATVATIQAKVSSEVAQVLRVNQAYTADKRISDLEAQLAALKATTDAVSTSDVMISG